MAKKKFTTSSDMHKMRVLGGKRGTRRIGRIKSCVFHPTEKRCIGFIVKRPDLLWMFHRKDLFVSLDGFDLKDGRIVIKEEAETTGPAACRRLGVNWDDCVIWEGMPLMTSDGTAVGYVGKITFSLATGEVRDVEASNGVTAKYLLGTLTVPADLIRGFKRGMGAQLAVRSDSRDAADGAQSFMGAILVSDDVWTLQPEGGWAESAGEFTAKATARVKEKVAEYKPKVQEATHAAGEAINEGAYAVGKQVAASKGMFSAFKDEYNKARNGEDVAELAAAEDKSADREESDTAISGMFSSFKEEFDKASGGADAEKKAKDEPAASSVGGMFSAFKEEFDKARSGDDSADSDADCDEGDEEPAVSAKKPIAKKAAPKKSSSVGGMFAAFKEEYDKAKNGE